MESSTGKQNGDTEAAAFFAAVPDTEHFRPTLWPAPFLKHFGGKVQRHFHICFVFLTLARFPVFFFFGVFFCAFVLFF